MPHQKVQKRPWFSQIKKTWWTGPNYSPENPTISGSHWSQVDTVVIQFLFPRWWWLTRLFYLFGRPLRSHPIIPPDPDGKLILTDWSTRLLSGCFKIRLITTLKLRRNLLKAAIKTEPVWPLAATNQAIFFATGLEKINIKKLKFILH